MSHDVGHFIPIGYGGSYACCAVQGYSLCPAAIVGAVDLAYRRRPVWGGRIEQGIQKIPEFPPKFEQQCKEIDVLMQLLSQVTCLEGYSGSTTLILEGELSEMSKNSSQ